MVPDKSRFAFAVPLGGTGGGTLLFWGSVAPLSNTAGKTGGLKPATGEGGSFFGGHVDDAEEECEVLLVQVLNILLLLWGMVAVWDLTEDVDGVWVE